MIPAVERPGGGARHRRRRPGFRPDIEGLRAVAVLAVVLYHAGPSVVPGGYVGVDVFYVISGFLITDLLWRELGRDGRISLAGFWGRRARRLLPAAILVLVLTMAASALLLPPLQLRSVWLDGLWCALYVGNYRFAATGTDYLAATTPSPFQHFWSLGVEEQFYLVWPLLLLGAVAAWRRWAPRWSPRAVAAVALGVVCAASLAASIWLTRADEPIAFFALPTRAWELGAGGLVALAAPALRRVPAAAGAALGWAGLAAVVAACGVLGAGTPFPGTAALLPVLGAAGVVAGGLAAGAQGPVVLLGRPLPRAIGRISYSWYLWHWPVLVLAPYALGAHPSLAGDLALAAASAVPAALTYRFVEDPVRRARLLTGRPRRSLATGAALSGVGVAACVASTVVIPSTFGAGLAPAARIRPSAPPASTRTAAGHGGRHAQPTPAQAAERSVASAQGQVAAAVAASVGTRDVPTNLQPPLADASASEAPPMVDGCLLGYTTSTPASCRFGDTASSRTVLLWGDSHAAMWFPAVDAWAIAHGDALVVQTKAACPPVHVTLFSPGLDRTWTECSDWYAGVLARAAATHPVLAVLAVAPNYDAAYHVVQDGPAWDAGMADAVRSLRADGARVVVMGPIPGPSSVVPDCLSANPTDVPACQFAPTYRRVSGGGLVGVLDGQPALAAAVQGAGGRFVATTPWFCTATTCVPIVEDLLVYRDISHITVPFAEYLSPLVGDEFDAALTSR